MAIRRIVRFPQPFLRQPTKLVSVVDSAVLRLVEDMAETMFHLGGAGLAAIQVGASERLFLIDPEVAGRKKGDPPVAFINPELSHFSSETDSKDEGCLSFPGVFVPVKRSLSVTVKALGQDGQPFELTAHDKDGVILARAIQHEYDHLQNRLLADYMGPVKRQMVKRKLERMTDQEAEAILLDRGE